MTFYRFSWYDLRTHVLIHWTLYHLGALSGMSRLSLVWLTSMFLKGFSLKLSHKFWEKCGLFGYIICSIQYKMFSLAWTSYMLRVGINIYISMLASGLYMWYISSFFRVINGLIQIDIFHMTYLWKSYFTDTWVWIWYWFWK